MAEVKSKKKKKGVIPSVPHDLEAETCKSKYCCLLGCDLSNSKLKVTIGVIYLLSIAYVILSSLEKTRPVIKEVLSEGNAIVLLVITILISAAISFYTLSHVPLWISLALYHLITTLVPFLFWLLLRLLGWVIFIFVSMYAIARFVLRAEDPISYVFDLYAFLDLAPAMLKARVESHGGVWAYFEGWYK